MSNTATLKLTKNGFQDQLSHNAETFSNILILIKRRPPQFAGFIENKYRHEHALIINYKLYIVSHILYDQRLYE